MDIESLRGEYEKRADKYEHLKDEVIFILNNELQRQKIPVHQITARVKPFDSFVDKARRQECNAPFDEILDLCGVRVICLFLTDLRRISEIIEEKFFIHTIDNKVYSKPEEVFGYMSVHYIGLLPTSFAGPRYDNLKGLKFEIQLRTIAMHAWATISHYLDYKTPAAVPSSLRKDFNALSALFYVADTHFELFFRSSQEAKEGAKEMAKNLLEIGKEEINLDTLTAYLRMRYPDRGHADSESTSELAEELYIAGYSRIEQLEAALQRSKRAFEDFEKKEFLSHGERAYDAALVRLSLAIADDNFCKVHKVHYPAKAREVFEKYRHLLS